MKQRDKVKVCLKCNKLYEKCYCARPTTFYMSLYEMDRILNQNKNYFK